MKTFLGEDMRGLMEAPINIAVGDNSLSIKALFDRNINLNLLISRLEDLTRSQLALSVLLTLIKQSIEKSR